ncbi:O-antigen ligase family protein [candidate division KSB1 bacterium]|nr:O-antigen ligase family protein [candidate division KSB1 bacterium]
MTSHIIFLRILEYLLYIFTAFSIISIAGTQISLGLVIIVWLAYMIVTRRMLIRNTGLELAFAAFIVTCIIATIFSLHPHASFINLKNLLLISVVYLIVGNVTNRQMVVRLVNIIVAVSAIVALIGVLTTNISAGDRVSAFHSVTMTWGAMSTIFMLLTASLIIFGASGKQRVWYSIAFVIQLIAVLFSLVRGSWIGFMAGIMLLAFIKSKKLIAGMVVFVIILFALAPAPIKTRILSITDLNVNSTHVRLVQWKNSINIFKDHPITGVGWIDLGELHRSYAPPGADLSYHAYQIGHFHNNFIMFIICFGLLGFGAGCYMIYRIARLQYLTYRKIPPDDQWMSAVSIGALAAFVGFWVNGLFDWTFGDAEPVTLLWLVVGLSLAIGNIIISEREQVKE